MTLWTDNAARFATQAESRVDELRHEGVREAIRVIFHSNIDRDRRAEVAWTHMVLMTDRQIFITPEIPNAELPVAWWAQHGAA